MPDNNQQEKIRRYRLLFHNDPPTNDLVQRMVTNELGSNVYVVGWEVERVINYQSPAPHSGMLPQRDIFVVLTYKELEQPAETARS